MYPASRYLGLWGNGLLISWIKFQREESRACEKKQIKKERLDQTSRRIRLDSKERKSKTQRACLLEAKCYSRRHRKDDQGSNCHPD